MKACRHRYIILFFTVFIILSFSSCKVKHTYTFSGESDQFKAELVVEETIKDERHPGRNEVKTTFKVTYKGEIDELSKYNELTISYKSSASGMDETFDLKKQLNSNTFSYQIGGKGVAMENKNDTIPAVIKLDGEIIEIPMESK